MWSNYFLFGVIRHSRYDFGEILACSSVQCCFSSLRLAGIRLCTALLRSHHSISIRLRSGLWLDHFNTLILFFFRHSGVDLLIFLGSLSCCMTQPLAVRHDGLKFDSRILRFTDMFIKYSMSARCPSSVEAKQAQIFSPPPPCITADSWRCLC